MTYPFLSEEWIQALEALRDEAPPTPGSAETLINMIVVGGPDGDVAAHLANGRLDRGLVEGAPTTVTVPYAVARTLIIDGDPSVAIRALMSGELTVVGNPASLLALQGQFGPPGAEYATFYRKVRAFTS
ncbi:MAG TPA: hypothetical protein VK816_07605 [Jatrophihabitantaceae bacterium]|nr:hypothetical protein [Jatrophihabitantaceae bacterium]